MKNRLFSFAIYIASAGVGMIALLSPFISPPQVHSGGYGDMRTGEMPLMLTVLLGLSLLVLLYEVQQQSLNTRLIALLGVLVAINSTLRFIEVAIPGPGGFTPIFFLIVLTGYIFGGRFGFLMGALTLLVSALITGGVGPWLPSQMFTAGWVGLTAPLCRIFVPRDHQGNSHREIIVLVVFGACWGLLYGAIMNLWTWPFMVGPTDQYWSPGVGFIETFKRYSVYYLVTSFAWDLGCMIGNILLILAFGVPTLKALRRFKMRFTFNYQPVVSGQGIVDSG